MYAFYSDAFFQRAKKSSVRILYFVCYTKWVLEIDRLNYTLCIDGKNKKLSINSDWYGNRGARLILYKL